MVFQIAWDLINGQRSFVTLEYSINFIDYLYIGHELVELLPMHHMPIPYNLILK